MEDYKGSCLCRGVQFTLTGQPQGVFACYCTHCSINAGGPCQFVRTARFSRTQLRLEDPQKLVSVYSITSGTDSGYAKEKHFCSVCGSTLWTVPLKHEGNVVVVRTSLLENGLTLLPPIAEVFTRHKPDYFSGILDVPGILGMPNV